MALTFDHLIRLEHYFPRPYSKYAIFMNGQFHDTEMNPVPKEHIVSSLEQYKDRGLYRLYERTCGGGTAYGTCAIGAPLMECPGLGNDCGKYSVEPIDEGHFYNLTIAELIPLLRV